MTSGLIPSSKGLLAYSDKLYYDNTISVDIDLPRYKVVGTYGNYYLGAVDPNDLYGYQVRNFVRNKFNFDVESIKIKIDKVAYKGILESEMSTISVRQAFLDKNNIDNKSYVLQGGYASMWAQPFEEQSALSPLPDFYKQYPKIKDTWLSDFQKIIDEIDKQIKSNKEAKDVIEPWNKMMSHFNILDSNMGSTQFADHEKKLAELSKDFVTEGNKVKSPGFWDNEIKPLIKVWERQIHLFNGWRTITIGEPDYSGWLEEIINSYNDVTLGRPIIYETWSAFYTHLEKTLKQAQFVNDRVVLNNDNRKSKIYGSGSSGMDAYQNQMTQTPSTVKYDWNTGNYYWRGQSSPNGIDYNSYRVSNWYKQVYSGSYIPTVDPNDEMWVHKVEAPSVLSGYEVSKQIARVNNMTFVMIGLPMIMSTLIHLGQDLILKPNKAEVIVDVLDAAASILEVVMRKVLPVQNALQTEYLGGPNTNIFGIVNWTQTGNTYPTDAFIDVDYKFYNPTGFEKDHDYVSNQIWSTTIKGKIVEVELNKWFNNWSEADSAMKAVVKPADGNSYNTQWQPWLYNSYSTVTGNFNFEMEYETYFWRLVNTK